MLPLHRLTQINLEEARDLGLLESTDTEFSDLFAELENSWSSAPDDLHAFWDGIDRIADYSESMTWLEVVDASRLVAHRVTTVKNLLYPLRGTLDPALTDIQPSINKLQRLLHDLASPAAGRPPVSTPVEDRIRGICDDLRANLCYLPPALPAAVVRADVLHSTFSNAWIVPEAARDLGALTSQGLRDALGLIHIPERSSSPDASQCLVKMSFKLTLSPDRLPEKFDPDFITDHANGLWLVRPTICHWPNERFVQRHSEDPDGGVAPHGRTIDISSADYSEGFPELILLHGPLAELEWSDLRLFTPPPMTRTIDEDHKGFLETIAGRLGRAVTP